VTVDDIVRVGVAAWPGVHMDLGAFTAHLRGLLGAELTPALLSELRIEDLVLAFAAAAGDDRALLAFQTALGEARGALARAGVSAEQAAETLQQLRCSLLTAAPGERPGVLAYSGRGRLGAWLRVIAVRTALKAAQRDERVAAVDDDILEAIGPGRDAELDAMRALYQGQLKQAFAAAIAELTARQRNLLRHSVIDHLSVDDLAALYRVHRATTARWLSDAREELIARTRDHMMRELKVSPDELASIFRLVHSDCDISVCRLLGEAG
jgi:RNA polymerase sigma-70 factor, ECF subfamily